MTREEKCKLAIERGFIYNPDNGLITGPSKKILNSKETNGYLIIGLKHNDKHFTLRAHQFAWYYVNQECVDCIDHINGDKEDNRICNLRSVSKQKNTFNTKAKGYYWNKNANKWKTQIGFNYKKIFIGYYDTEDEAKLAYIEAKNKYHIID